MHFHSFTRPADPGQLKLDIFHHDNCTAPNEKGLRLVLPARTRISFVPCKLNLIKNLMKYTPTLGAASSHESDGYVFPLMNSAHAFVLNVWKESGRNFNSQGVWILGSAVLMAIGAPAVAKFLFLCGDFQGEGVGHKEYRAICKCKHTVCRRGVEFKQKMKYIVCDLISQCLSSQNNLKLFLWDKINNYFNEEFSHLEAEMLQSCQTYILQSTKWENCAEKQANTINNKSTAYVYSPSLFFKLTCSLCFYLLCSPFITWDRRWVKSWASKVLRSKLSTK